MTTLRDDDPADWRVAAAVYRGFAPLPLVEAFIIIDLASAAGDLWAARKGWAAREAAPTPAVDSGGGGINDELRGVGEPPTTSTPTPC